MLLKILNIRKKTLVLEFLFNKAADLKACFFIKKNIPTSVFSFEYCEIFKNSFWNTFCSLYFSKNLCDDRILWTSLGTKLKFIIFLLLLYYCFVFLRNSSVRIGSPWLFCICFHTKILSKCKFRTHYNVGSSTILIESSAELLRLTCPSNLLWKNMNMSFFNNMLCYYFFLEVVLPSWLNVKTHRRVKELSIQIAKIDSNYRLQRLALEYQKQSPRGVPWSYS